MSITLSLLSPDTDGVVGGIRFFFDGEEVKSHQSPSGEESTEHIKDEQPLRDPAASTDAAESGLLLLNTQEGTASDAENTRRTVTSSRPRRRRPLETRPVVSYC
jgi:hypothetical protein